MKPVLSAVRHSASNREIVLHILQLMGSPEVASITGNVLPRDVAICMLQARMPGICTRILSFYFSNSPTGLKG